MKRKFWTSLVIFLWGLGAMTAPMASYDDRFGSPPDTFSGPEAGEKAPDFHLETLDGASAHLQESLKKGPVVLEFGGPPSRSIV